jgi:hypothetical protein
MRRNRIAEAEGILDEHAEASDGRAIPGQSADAYTTTSKHHPSRLWAREPEQDIVDYVTGSAGMPGVYERPAPRSDLQRWTAPVEDDSWRPEPDTDYYSKADFRARNDQADGPYGGYNHAGTPLAFQVVRRSR